MAESLGRNRNTFRPALRFPTDPYRSMELPTRTKDIMKAGTSSNPNSGQNFNVQSRRPPWELDLESLQEVTSSCDDKKVILIIGSPPSTSLEPLITSPHLRGSLVVVVTSDSTSPNISPSAAVPTVRILRLRPSPTAPEPEIYTASRLTFIFEWADRVVKDWRRDVERCDHTHIQSSSFTSIHEDDEISGAHRTRRRHLSMRLKRKPRPSTFHDARSAEDLSPASSPFLNWSKVARNRTMSGDLSQSRNGSSVTVSSVSSGFLEPSVEVGGRESLQSVDSFYGAESTGNLLNSNDAPPSSTRTLKSARSSSTLTHISTPTYMGDVRNTLPFTSSPLSSSVPISRSRSRPISVFSTFSISGKGATSKLSKDGQTTSNPPTASKRSFDIIINFLPPAVAHGRFGSGAIATLSSSTVHAKVLLKQTILVTTASQRFLLPPVGTRPPSPENSRTISPVSTRSSLPVIPKPNDVTAPESQDQSRDGMAQFRGRPRRESTSRRISQAFGAMFSVKLPTELPPTPPSSESASEASASPPLENTRPSARSSISEYINPRDAVTSNNGSSVSKLVHVLPFEHACQTQHGRNTGIESAKLIRSLEAFLLSWSYGAKAMASKISSSDSSSSLNTMGSGDSVPSVLMQEPTIGAKGKIKPFLLDLSGFSDVLRVQGLADSDASTAWHIPLLIIMGALDDQASNADVGCDELTPSLLTPTWRPNSLARPTTTSSTPRAGPPLPSNTAPPPLRSLSRWGTSQQATTRWESPTGLASIGRMSAGNGQLDSSWAKKRAWLGGVNDVLLLPHPEGNFLVTQQQGGQSTLQGSTVVGGSHSNRARRHSIGVSATGYASTGTPPNVTKLSHLRSVTGPIDVNTPADHSLSAIPGPSAPPTSWNGLPSSNSTSRNGGNPLVVVNTAIVASGDRRTGKSPLSNGSPPITPITSSPATVPDTATAVSRSKSMKGSSGMVTNTSTSVNQRFQSIPLSTPPSSPVATSSESSHGNPGVALGSKRQLVNPTRQEAGRSSGWTSSVSLTRALKGSPSSLTIRTVSGQPATSSQVASGTNQVSNLPRPPSPITFRRWTIHRGAKDDNVFPSEGIPPDFAEVDRYSEPPSSRKEKWWWSQAVRAFGKKSRL